MELLDIDIRLIFAILNGKVSAAINRKLTHNFHHAGLNITPEQWTVLLYLSEKDGITQQHLCNATYKDKPGMTRLIDSMERANMVVRTANKEDRRINQVYLTRTGREMKEKSQHIAIKTLKESLRGLGIEELKISQEVLRKIFNNTKEPAYSSTKKPREKTEA